MIRQHSYALTRASFDLRKEIEFYFAFPVQEKLKNCEKAGEQAAEPKAAGLYYPTAPGIRRPQSRADGCTARRKDQHAGPLSRTKKQSPFSSHQHHVRSFARHRFQHVQQTAVPLSGEPAKV